MARWFPTQCASLAHQQMRLGIAMLMCPVEVQCSQSNPNLKVKLCNYYLWSVVWTFGEWSACSVTCGGGTSTRVTECKGSDGSTLADDQCGAGYLTEDQDCNTQSCPCENLLDQVPNRGIGKIGINVFQCLPLGNGVIVPLHVMEELGPDKRYIECHCHCHCCCWLF